MPTSKTKTHTKRAGKIVEDTQKNPQKQQAAPAPPQPSRRSIKKERHQREHAIEKQRQNYSQSVYTARFAHFRILRISSWLIGTGIMISLSFGLWRLHNTVFTTIENTQQLLFVQEMRRTDIIDFSILEKVRKSTTEKYTNLSTSTPMAIFGTPLSSPGLDTEASVVEE